MDNPVPNGQLVVTLGISHHLKVGVLGPPLPSEASLLPKGEIRISEVVRQCVITVLQDFEAMHVGLGERPVWSGLSPYQIMFKITIEKRTPTTDDLNHRRLQRCAHRVSKNSLLDLAAPMCWENS